MKYPKTSLLSSLLSDLHNALFAEKSDISTESVLELRNANAYSRRKFLTDTTKAVGLIGLSSTLPLTLFSSPNEENKKMFSSQTAKIAIIGGGLAGLNCAYQLQKKGIVAEIYEADKRVGGRILTKKDIFGAGITTEFGGEFIDSNHKDMLSLAKEFHLELNDTQKDVTENKLVKDIYAFNGKIYSEKEVIDEFRKVAPKIAEDLKKCGKDFDTPHCEALDKTSLEAYIRSFACEKWLQDLLISAYIAEYGLDASEQSSLNFVSMISTNTKAGFEIFGDSDERFKIKGGNQLLTDKLQEKLKDQIKFEYKLTSVLAEKEGYKLTFEGKDPILADYVVLAIPFSILRNIKLQIKGMSEEKQKCINELGYGQNNKLMLGFKNRFWRNSDLKTAGYILNSDIQNGWDSSQMQTNNEGEGGYTIFIGGKPSIDMAKQAQDAGLKDSVPDGILQDYLTKLEAIFKGTKANYNGKNKAALWSNNPFINGSYACYKVGQWTTISGQEIEPIGNIFFAGEHCSSDFQGYMNGAAETGRIAAEAIVKKLK